MMNGTSDHNPFVGPRPIEEGRALYGREAEVAELYHQLQARRVVVLHSPSGAGKSSLVQAGLIPRLRAAGFDVWPPIRVNHDPGRTDGSNRYLLSVLLSIESGLPERLQRSEDELAGLDLVSYLKTRPRKKRLAGSPTVLLFDQFEEVLTVDPQNIAAKQRFFDAVGAALDDGKVWALFVLREDYLGAFAPYRERVPTHMSNTFRLDMLTREGAREAAVRAARDGGREFVAVDQLIEDLSRVVIQRIDGSVEVTQGLYVEPVQLQVVGRRLWDAMPREATRIEAEHLTAFADVSRALGGYYADAVARAAGGDEAVERKIREWVGERLIVGGIRSPVRREAEQSAGLDNLLIDVLVNLYLVRTEQRAGALWYELSHDRMVEPVTAENVVWDEAHLHPMQLRARLWEQGRRAPTLLLGEPDLPAASAWASAAPARLTDREREFLGLSVEARDRERRARRLTQLVLLVVFLALLGAIGFALYAQDLAQKARAAEALAIDEKQKAVASEQRARASELTAREAEAAAKASEENARAQEQRATTAQGEAEQSAAQAAAAEEDARRQAVEALSQKSAAESAKQRANDGLYMQAVTRLRADPAATVPFLARVLDPTSAKGWREAALHALSQTFPKNLLRLPQGGAAGGAVAMSGDHGMVVSGLTDGQVLVWRRDQASRPAVLARGQPWVRELVVGPDGAEIVWITAESATGKGGGRVWWWSAARSAVAELALPAGGGAWAIGMSSEGALAIGRSDGSVWVQRGAETAPTQLGQLGRGVMSLAWLPDGRLVVATQHQIYVVSGAGGLDTPRFTLDAGQTIRRISASADGRRIAALTDRGGVLAGELAGDQPLTALRGVRDVITLSFVGPSSALAVGYSSGEVGLLPTGELPELRLLGHTAAITAFGPSADGERFASLSKDGTIRVWPTDPRPTSPSASATLDALMAQLTAESNTVCVAADAREEFLDEAPSQARAQAEACTDQLEF